MNGRYSDRDPEFRSNGTWSFDYFQENTDPSLRDTEYTNIALIRCIEDGVPVVVAPELEGSTYGKLAGKQVSVANVTPTETNVKALDWHRTWSGLSERNQSI